MADDVKKEPEPPFLNTAEAAAWLRLTKNTLEKMRGATDRVVLADRVGGDRRDVHHL